MGIVRVVVVACVSCPLVAFLPCFCMLPGLSGGKALSGARGTVQYAGHTYNAAHWSAIARKHSTSMYT